MLLGRSIIKCKLNWRKSTSQCKQNALTSRKNLELRRRYRKKLCKISRCIKKLTSKISSCAKITLTCLLTSSRYQLIKKKSWICKIKLTIEIKSAIEWVKSFSGLRRTVESSNPDASSWKINHSTTRMRLEHWGLSCKLVQAADMTLERQEYPE